MKRALKSALTFVLIVATLLSVAPMTFAASTPAIKIKLSGKTLNVSPILYHDGRTYAPYDSLFKALGAKASYNQETKTITAVSGTTTVTLGVEESLITVSTNGTENQLYNDSMPIVDTTSGKIYVSVRNAAIFGYVVSWDDLSRTITLQSVDSLITSSGATYSVMDKYLAFNKQFLSKSKALDGTFNLTADTDSLYHDNYYDYDDSGAENSEADTVKLAPLSVRGTVTGVLDQGGDEMSVNLKTNVSSVLPQLVTDEAIDDETIAMLKQLDNIDMNIIVNNETGLLYVKSPLICVLTGQAEDAWLCLETGEALSETNFSNTSEFSIFSIGNFSSFRDFVSTTLKDYLLYDDCSYVADTLADLNARFSDQAMVKEGDNYVLTYSYDNSDDDYGNYNSKETSKLTFQFNKDTFTGITYSMLSETCYSYSDYYGDDILGSALDTSSVEATYSFTSAGKGSLSLVTVSNGVTELKVTADYTFSDTTSTPAREPSEGSNIISVFSLGELKESAAAQLTGADTAA